MLVYAESKIPYYNCNAIVYLDSLKVSKDTTKRHGWDYKNLNGEDVVFVNVIVSDRHYVVNVSGADEKIVVAECDRLINEQLTKLQLPPVENE